jgi:hypothetical protein
MLSPQGRRELVNETMRREANLKMRAPTRLGRLTTIGTGGAAFLISALMMFAPSAGATVLHKPFNQFPGGVSVSTQFEHCAKVKTVKMPTWSQKTGVFHAYGTGKAPPCKITGNLASYADWDGSFNFQGPFMWTSNGTHVVNISWKAVYAMAWSVAKTGCVLNYNVALSECYASAQVAVLMAGLTYDTNNFTQFNSPVSTPLPQNYSYVSNVSQRTCMPTCTVTSSNTSSGILNGSNVGTTVGNSIYNESGSYAIANDSHPYELYFTVILLIFVEAFTINAKTTSPLSASASINMGTLGNGFTVGSISMT